MEKCKYCGSEVKSQEEQELYAAECRKAGKHRVHYDYFCDGVLTLGTDPFAEEIRGDFSESWDCQGNRHHSAMEI